MQRIKGIARTISYNETCDYFVDEYNSYEELYSNLNKGDKVFVKEHENDELYLMEVSMKEAGNGMIFLKDDVKEIMISKEYPCFKILKIFLKDINGEDVNVGDVVLYDHHLCNKKETIKKVTRVKWADQEKGFFPFYLTKNNEVENITLGTEDDIKQSLPSMGLLLKQLKEKHEKSEE